jgi:hypothetical protein
MPRTPIRTPTQHLDDLLTFADAARYLGIVPRTLRGWVKGKKFPPPLRLGNPRKPVLRYRVTDLQRFLDREARRGN